MSRPLASPLNSIICAGLVCLLASPAAMAQTWDAGLNSSDWGNGVNWSGDASPAVNGNVIINDGSLSSQPLISAGDSFTVQQTTISAGSLTLGGSLTSNVTVNNSGTFTIQVGGDLSGNVTNTAGTFNNSGVVSGTVSNTGTLHVSNGASFQALSNNGLFDLNGGATSILGTMTLGAGSSLSIEMADYQYGGLPIEAGNAVLGGLLIIDFSSIPFLDDSWAFDLIRVGGDFTGGFSGFEVTGLASDLSFSTIQFSDSYTVIVERVITTPVPEPEIYAMMGLGLGLLGFVARRRKLKLAV